MDAPSKSPVKKRGRPRVFTDEERIRRKNERIHLKYQTDPNFRLHEQKRLKRYHKANRDKDLKRSRAYYNAHKDDPKFLETRRRRSARNHEERKRRDI